MGFAWQLPNARPRQRSLYSSAPILPPAPDRAMQDRIERSRLFREEGRAEGEARGEQLGRSAALRVAIADLCDVLGISVTPTQIESLSTMSDEQLDALRNTIKRERRWP